MMIYDIAGLRVKIKNQYTFTDKFCATYLSEDQTTPADIIAEMSEEEFLEEKKNSLGFSDGYIENICLYRSICMQIPKLNRMLLHAAVLEYDNRAYAFLGRSGTGKSTHTGLWLQYIPGSKIVNGDKPILEYADNGFTVYGTPWMGKERLGCNTKSRLHALCFLEQAKENSIQRLSAAEVSARLFPQVLIPQTEESAAATLELIDRMICTIPAYLLKCDISEQAVQTAFEALTGDPYEKIKFINKEEQQ